MTIKTSDLCDENADKVRIAEPISFKDFGGKKNFCGKIHTVKCFENNPFVRAALEKNGEGKVLVVDGGGSLKCALLGDMLGEIAVKNKWNGIILFGCIRDSVALSKLKLGVKALNTNPLKSKKENKGEENITVNFANIDFVPGEFVYCDEDGIIVSKEELA
ncbi:MAG: ribonuclease E activity regulator RraA [Ignavibacteria bacterium]|nr:ribonuclease E activity regulator RraA [Ignavibacteria bacterium]